jgi:hypothetical protein
VLYLAVFLNYVSYIASKSGKCGKILGLLSYCHILKVVAYILPYECKFS